MDRKIRRTVEDTTSETSDTTTSSQGERTRVRKNTDNNDKQRQLDFDSLTKNANLYANESKRSRMLELKEQAQRTKSVKNVVTVLELAKKIMYFEFRRLRESELWDSYIKPENLPEPDDTPNMNFHLYQWSQMPQTEYFPEALKICQKYVKVVKGLDELIEEPLGAVGNKLRLFKENREEWGARFMRTLDQATYHVIRRLELQFNRLNQFISDYYVETDDLKLGMWARLDIRLKAKDPMPPIVFLLKKMEATVRIPDGFTDQDYIVRLMHFPLDFLSPTCPLSDVPSFPLEKNMLDEELRIIRRHEGVQARQMIKEKKLLQTIQHWRKFTIDNSKKSPPRKRAKSTSQPSRAKDTDTLSSSSSGDTVYEMDSNTTIQSRDKFGETAPSAKPRPGVAFWEKLKTDQNKSMNDAFRSSIRTIISSERGSLSSLNPVHSKSEIRETRVSDVEKDLTVLKQFRADLTAIPGLAMALTDCDSIDLLHSDGKLRESDEVKPQSISNLSAEGSSQHMWKPDQPVMSSLQWAYADMELLDIPAEASEADCLDLLFGDSNHEGCHSLKTLIRETTIRQKKTPVEPRRSTLRHFYDEEMGWQPVKQIVMELEKARDAQYCDAMAVSPPFQGLINARKHTILGGVYYLDIIDHVPQPFELKNHSFVQYKIGDDCITKHEFLVDYEEGENGSVGAGLEALIQVTLPIPNVFYRKEPKLVIWDPNERFWSKARVHCTRRIDESHIESYLAASGPLAFAFRRFTELPYKEWRISPDSEGGINFTLECQTLTLDFHFSQCQVCLKKIQDKEVGGKAEVFNSLIKVYMSPPKLIHRMRSVGLDIFPERDSFVYVTPNTVKDPVLEEHCYFCVAVFSSLAEFTSAKWNFEGGMNEIFFLARERNHPSVRFTLFNSSKERSVVYKINLETDKPDPSRLDESYDFCHDLLLLFEQAFKTRANTQFKPPKEILCLYYFLLKTRVFSFSGKSDVLGEGEKPLVIYTKSRRRKRKLRRGGSEVRSGSARSSAGTIR